MTTALPPTPRTADEATTLAAFLDRYRAVARHKAEGLCDQKLRMRLPGHPSDLTIMGLLFHLASVEDYWWQFVVRGAEIPEPWRTPWSSDDDGFDFRADGLTGAEVLAQFDKSVADARQVQGGSADLDALNAGRRHDGEAVTVRWVLVHLIEEYARHCGHLDLLREAVDGSVGD